MPYDLLLLFSSSFLAATLFPAQSEAVLAGLVLAAHHDAVLLVAVATAGNVLGSCVNWLLGRYLAYFERHRWFPLKEPRLTQAKRLYRRFGTWSLLFAWLPLIGDPLTLIAGLMRTPLPLFLALVTLGKAARYALVAAVL